MNIIISGKQMDLTSGIKGAIEEKIGRLDYYLHPETEVKVTVSAKKARHTIEVTIIPISGPRIGTAAHIARIKLINIAYGLLKIVILINIIINNIAESIA